MKRRYRFIIKLALWLAGIYLLALCILYLFQEKLLFHPHVLQQDHIFKFAGDFEEVFIPVDTNVKLHGILFKAKQSKGLVFYLHGNGGCVDGRENAATVFTSAGYDLFMPDYRGYGKSGGHIESEAQINDDMEKAFNFIKKDYTGNVIIAGYSIGTGPATHLAASKKIQSLILQAPYYSLSELESEKVPLIPGFIKRYRFDTYKEISKVQAPVYIFHGTDDELIPYGHSVKLKKELGDNAVLIPLKGEGHSFMNDNPLYREKVLEILKE